MCLPEDLLLKQIEGFCQRPSPRTALGRVRVTTQRLGSECSCQANDCTSIYSKSIQSNFATRNSAKVIGSVFSYCNSGDVGAAVGVTLGRDLPAALIPLQGSRGMHRLEAL